MSVKKIATLVKNKNNYSFKWFLIDPYKNNVRKDKWKNMMLFGDTGSLLWEVTKFFQKLKYDRFSVYTGNEDYLKRNYNKIELFSYEMILKIKNKLFKYDDLYYYNLNIYICQNKYTDEQVELLILELEDKERQRFEKLKTKFSLVKENLNYKREIIPEEVRVAVWRRDEGKCAKCGSRNKLEYDHIIPISKGGSNTLRNIELLCENCNRKKKDNIE